MVESVSLVVAYMGIVMLPFFFNRSIQYSWLFSLFQVLFCLFLLLFLYIIDANGGEKEDYIKYELIGGGSLGLFKLYFYFG